MKKPLFLAVAALLVLAFVAGAFVYKSRQAAEGAQQVAEHRAALVRPHARVLGPADARVEIVEFFDPACETCRRFYPFVKEILAAHPQQVRLVLRYAPFHDNSAYVVGVLEAAGRQGKYWETLEALLAVQDDWVVHHAVQPPAVWQHVERFGPGLGLDLERLQHDMQSPEIARLVAQDLEDARILEVSKTPEFFVNGKPLPSFGFEPLQAMVDAALTGAD
jgi:protein-disulfide isomerase